MAWIEGRVNSKKLVQTLLDEIVGSGVGWEYVPSFSSPDIYVSADTRDGTVIKNTISGSEIFLGFHQVGYLVGFLGMVVSVYTDFKASPGLDNLGSFTDRKLHYLFVGKTADVGAQVSKEGYGMSYKISISPERVTIAVKFEQALDNQWSIYQFGAIRNTSGTGYNKNVFALFTSWGYRPAIGHELLLYLRGIKIPQITYCQGVHDIEKNGSIDAYEIVSPLRVKNINGGNEGLLDLYMSISQNAFREGDEVAIDGRTYIAFPVNMYPHIHNQVSFSNSLNYPYVGICNVLIPKE